MVVVLLVLVVLGVLEGEGEELVVVVVVEEVVVVVVVLLLAHVVVVPSQLEGCSSTLAVVAVGRGEGGDGRRIHFQNLVTDPTLSGGEKPKTWKSSCVCPCFSFFNFLLCGFSVCFTTHINNSQMQALENEYLLPYFGKETKPYFDIDQSPRMGEIFQMGNCDCQMIQSCRDCRLTIFKANHYWNIMFLWVGWTL